jgi:hypothetical protein
MTDLKVGNKLWYVDRYRKNSGHEVIVKKIGRIYVTLSNFERFEKGVVGWRTNSGRCYLSKADYMAIMRRDDLWQKLRWRLNGEPPSNLDESAIRKIAEQCGVTLE